MRARYILIAALAGLAGCREAPSPAPEYRPEEAGTIDHALCLLGFDGIPIQQLPTGHHLVGVELNGRPAKFILDTGANVTVLNSSFGDDFGLAQGSSFPGAAIGLGGSIDAQQVPIDQLKIGTVQVRQNRIVTADLSNLSRFLRSIAGQTVHGIIGQDVMAEHRAVIDVSRPILYLIAKDQEPAPVPAEQCAGKSLES